MHVLTDEKINQLNF